MAAMCVTIITSASCSRGLRRGEQHMHLVVASTPRYCVDCFLRRNHFDSPPSFALHSKTLPFAPNDTNADSPTLTLGASKLRGGSLQDINIAPGAQDQLTSWSKEWLAPTCELLLCHDIIYTSHILHCKNLCEVIVGHRRWSLFFKVGSDHRYRYLAVRSTPARVARPA